MQLALLKMSLQTNQNTTSCRYHNLNHKKAVAKHQVKYVCA